MPNWVDTLKKYRRQIGSHAMLFFVLASATLGFSVSFGGSGGNKYRGMLQTLGFLMFAIGVIISIVRAFSTFFVRRPARGLIDGLAAGLICGILGGYFGYGYHEEVGFRSDPSYVRVGLCILFATPVGGILGLTFDLFRSDRAISWGKYLGAVALGVALLFAFVGGAIFVFVPQVNGHGIVTADLQLLFEIFLVTVCVFVAIEERWRKRRVALATLLLAASFFGARVFTHLKTFNADDNTGRLSERQYYATDVGRFDLAVAILVLMCWSTLTFSGIYYGPQLRWFEPHSSAQVTKSQEIVPVEGKQESDSVCLESD